MTGNKITNLNPKWFENFQNLEGLLLSNNNIEEFPDNVFSSLNKLTYFEVNGNKLKIFHPNSFFNLKDLRNLDMSNNDITELPRDVFKPLEKLSILWIDNNKLKTIHSDSFGKHNNLVTTGLTNNSIEAIDEKIFDKVTFNFIHLGGNVCFKYSIKVDEKSVEKLKKCFENYRPRDYDGENLL